MGEAQTAAAMRMLSMITLAEPLRSSVFPRGQDMGSAASGTLNGWARVVAGGVVPWRESMGQ
jgi:hypothetical protein